MTTGSGGTYRAEMAQENADDMTCTLQLLLEEQQARDEKNARCDAEWKKSISATVRPDA